jgi:hypothetical protein
MTAQDSKDRNLRAEHEHRCVGRTNSEASPQSDTLVPQAPTLDSEYCAEVGRIERGSI